MYKKGFELSINFLVVIVLMIIILGFGITMFTDLFQKAQEWNYNVDAQSERQLNDLLDTGESVVLPRNVRTVDAGERSIFQLAVINDITNNAQFKLEIDKPNVPGYDFEILEPVNGEIGSGVNEGMRLFTKFAISPPKNMPKGTYIFDVRVCYRPSHHSTPRRGCSSPYKLHSDPMKIYLNVR